MEIKNPKDLEKLLIVCRKHGVESLTLGTTQIKLGDKPTRRRSGKATTEDTRDPITEGFSPEEILMWSAGGDMPMEGN